MTTIQGKTVVLRRYRREDAEAIFRSTQNDTVRRLTGTQAQFVLEDILRYIDMNANADDRAGFIIASPETDEALGEVVLNQLDPVNHHANFRIAIFREEDFNKGYGTEATRLLLGYGFRELNLHRVELSVYAFNTRAMRVYEKLGFRKEGVLRERLLWEGAYHDEVLMGILAEEFVDEADS